MKLSHILKTSVAAMAVSIPAAALALDAVAVTDLNVRSGPGPQFDIVGVIGGGEAAMLEGCLEDGTWCKVSHEGASGWSYAPYLGFTQETDVVILPERPAEIEVSTVTYEDTEGTTENQREGAAAGATLGALAAYAAGGPVGGIIAGGILGGAAGSASAEPEMETVTYIEANPVDVVYLDGEVAVGAGVPEAVVTYEVPDKPAYRYANINGQTVLIDPQTSAIVYVFR